MEFRALYDNFKMYFDHKKPLKKNNKKKQPTWHKQKKSCNEIALFSKRCLGGFFLSMQQDN